jgi:hypothetical protein
VADGERRVEPLDRRDARRHEPVVPAADDDLLHALEPLPQLLDHVDCRVLRLGHRADRLDRVEDPLHRGRFEADHGHVTVEPARRLVDLAVGDRAHAAQLLGQDQVRPRHRERRLVQRVDRRPGLDRSLHQAVDLVRGRTCEVVHAAGDHPDLAGLGRLVAFVGDADELVTEAQREHDLGGGREEGDDAHPASVGRIVRPSGRRGAGGWRPQTAGGGEDGRRRLDRPPWRLRRA